MYVTFCSLDVVSHASLLTSRWQEHEADEGARAAVARAAARAVARAAAWLVRMARTGPHGCRLRDRGAASCVVVTVHVMSIDSRDNAAACARAVINLTTMLAAWHRVEHCWQVTSRCQVTMVERRQCTNIGGWAASSSTSKRSLVYVQCVSPIKSPVYVRSKPRRDVAYDRTILRHFRSTFQRLSWTKT